jgi:transcription elongation factor Elf1
MKQPSKRALKKLQEEAFKRDFQRLAMERSITCPTCGEELVAVSLEPPQPGVVQCYACETMIPVTLDKAVYADFRSWTVRAADRLN